MGLEELEVNPGRAWEEGSGCLLDWVLGSGVSGFLESWPSVSNSGEEYNLDFP